MSYLSFNHTCELSLFGRETPTLKRYIPSKLTDILDNFTNLPLCSYNIPSLFILKLKISLFEK